MPAVHIEDEFLDQYASGTLPEERLEGVEEHLLFCQACQSRLQASDEFGMLFRIAAVQPDARPQHGWRSFWNHDLSMRAASWTAAAAVAGIVFLLAEPFGKPLTAPETVFMQSLRGPEASAQIRAGKPALLVFDIAPAASVNQYEARVVNPVGTQILASKVSLKDGRIAVLVSRLPAGSYWVRIYRTDDREPIAEYGLRSR